MMRQQEFGIHSVSGDYEAPPWDHPAQLTEPTTFPWVMMMVMVTVMVMVMVMMVVFIMMIVVV